MAKRIMRAFKMNEISAVDRPAQAHATVVLMKRDDSDDEYLKRNFNAAARHKDAKSGVALPDGSFPIATAEDLANARRLVGHAKDKAAAEAHIARRAKALGLSKIIEDQLADASDDELQKIAEALEPTESVMTEEEVKKAVEAATAEIKKELDDTKAALDLAKKDSVKDSADGDTLPNGRGKKPKKNPDPDGADEGKESKKSFELPEEITKALAEGEELKKRLAVLEAEKEIVAFGKRAVGLGLPEAHGEILRKAYAGDADGITKLEALIKGFSAQAASGKLFAEFGSAQGGSGSGSAKAEIDGQAAEYRKTQIAIGKKCSPEQAFAHIYTDPAHADLKKRYDAEEVAKRHTAAA